MTNMRTNYFKELLNHKANELNNMEIQNNQVLTA